MKESQISSDQAQRNSRAKNKTLNFYNTNSLYIKPIKTTSFVLLH